MFSIDCTPHTSASMPIYHSQPAEAPLYLLIYLSHLHPNSFVVIAELRMLGEYDFHRKLGFKCSYQPGNYCKQPLKMKQPIPNLDLLYTVKLRGIGRIISDFCSFKASRSLEGKGLMPIGLSIQLHFIDRKSKRNFLLWRYSHIPQSPPYFRLSQR